MRNTVSNAVIIAMMVTALLAGCSGEREAQQQAAAAAAEAAAKAQQLAYEKEIRAARLERETRLQRPDGWLSLVGLHWLEVGTTFVGSADRKGVKLAVGPENLGTLVVDKAGTVTFTAEKSAEVLIDGQPAAGKVTLVPDSKGTPTVVGFNRGDASFILIERSGRFALRVRDAMARTRMQFTGIDYFDINPGLRFDARFEPHPPGKTIDIATMIGTVEPMMNPGVVVFEKEGKTFRLEAVDEGDGQLFLVFADRTSGHETYAAARFLYAKPADAAGHTVVDFNLAYNPPCAFTPFSTCPLPPPENRMDLAVTAGEKKPRKIGG